MWAKIQEFHSISKIFDCQKHLHVFGRYEQVRVQILHRFCHQVCSDQRNSMIEVNTQFKRWGNTLLQEGTPSLCLHLWGRSCTGSQEPHRPQSFLGTPPVLEHAVMTSDPAGEKTRRGKWQPMQQPQRRRRRRGSTGPSCQPELLQQQKSLWVYCFFLCCVSFFHSWWDWTGPEPAKSDGSVWRQRFKRVQRRLNQIWIWGVLGLML